jgi:hypothetical protein
MNPSATECEPLLKEASFLLKQRQRPIRAVTVFGKGPGLPDMHSDRVSQMSGTFRAALELALE